MKKTLTLLAGISLASSVFAGTTGVIDIAHIFKSVPQGLAATKAIEASLQPKMKLIDAKLQKLEATVQAYVKAHPKATPEQIQKHEGKILKEAQVLQKHEEALHQTAMTKMTAAGKAFKAQLNKDVAAVAKKDNLELVLNKQTAVYTGKTIHKITHPVRNLMTTQAKK